MAYLTKKTTLLFKKESTPDTFEQPAVTDAFPCENIEFDPQVPVQELKLARGDFSRDPSVPGSRSANLKFDAVVHYSGTAATAPTWFTLLEGCGLKLNTHTTTGVSLINDTLVARAPVSFQFQMMDEGATPSVYTVKLRGCMGDCKITGSKVGEYIKASFEFKCIIYSVTDVAFGSYLAPSFATYSPDVMLSMGVTLNGVGQCINQFTFALNNVVELFSCAAQSEGFSGAHIVDRNPTIEIDPDLKSLATEDDWTHLTGATQMAFLAQISGPIVFSAPKAQLIEYKFGEREGHYTSQKKLQCNRENGNDGFEIIHGSKT